MCAYSKSGKRQERERERIRAHSVRAEPEEEEADTLESRGGVIISSLLLRICAHLLFFLFASLSLALR